MATKTTTLADLQAKRAAVDEEMAPLLRERHAQLRTDRDAIEATLAPLYAELESPDCTHAREAELRTQIKATREPMVAIDEELSDLTRQLADKKTGIAKTA